MSDLATQYDDGVFEPDEETLISALRNQDDIPILMDIVAERVDVEKTAFSVSQEEHLAHSFDDPLMDEELKEEAVSESVQQEASQNDFFDHSLDTATPDNVVAGSVLSQELIAKTIAEVLEKRLPELVSEVMQALQSARAVQNGNTIQEE
jgi:hypothetical protein